jgi:hypothetical protein
VIKTDQRVTDDVFSLYNSKFGDYVDRNYLEKNDITDTARSASYLDLRIEIDSMGL